jgi:hypothetical protein
MDQLHKVEFATDIGCNVSDETILAQVKANIRRAAFLLVSN